MPLLWVFYALTAGVSDACPMIVTSAGFPNTFPTAMSILEVMSYRSPASFSCEMPENMFEFVVIIVKSFYRLFHEVLSSVIRKHTVQRSS